MGVSCDSCLKGNFRGKRYKCLICFDYDLCAACFELGVTSTRHLTDHPMQCILTRTDFDVYYGGEAVSVEQPQAFTCPFCGRMGLTEATLQEHVTSEHADSSTEVVCPVCAALPGGEPNHVTDDFATHLTLEHRSPRELEEPQTAIRGRRAPHPTRGLNSARARRSQMQFSSNTGLSSLSPNNRDSMDPIAELLSQLSGVRRAANLGQSHPTPQLQQLQMQLQLDRHSSTPLRQPFDRAPIERVIRRHQQQSSQQQLQTNSSQSTANTTQQQLPYVVLMEPNPSPATLAAAAAHVTQSSNAGNQNTNTSIAPALKSSNSSQFLLSRCNEVVFTENELQHIEVQRVDRSLFVQELLLTTLTESLNLDERYPNSSSQSLQSYEPHLNSAYQCCSDDDDDDQQVFGDNENHPNLNCNENERPTALQLFNTTKQLNSNPNQPLQPQHLQQPLLHRRQQNKSRQTSGSRLSNTANSANSNTSRNVNRTDRTDRTGGTSPNASTRRKVLRGQPSEPPPH